MENFPISFEHNRNYAIDTNIMNNLGQQPQQRHQFHAYPMLNNALAYHNPGQQPQQRHQFHAYPMLNNALAYHNPGQQPQQRHQFHAYPMLNNALAYHNPGQQQYQFLPNMQLLQPMGGTAAHTIQQQGQEQLNPISHLASVANGISYPTGQQERQLLTNFDLAFNNRFPLQEQRNPQSYGAVSLNTFHQIPIMPNSIVTNQTSGHQAQWTEPSTLDCNASYHHSQQQEYSPDGRFRCIPCHKEFSGIAYLKQHHVARHSGLRAHRCNQCGKHFKTEAELRGHAIRHNVASKPYGCEFCSKQYWYKYDLKKHIEGNHTEKPHGCDHCSKRFCRKDYLKRHLRMHDATYIAMKSNRRVNRIASNSSSTSSSGTEQRYNNQFPLNAQFDSPQALA
uniref:C2H2-type domain-containing protein n=1 Tax=Glossina pallidipes TaxID=7398 RepID=A0A1B0AHC8_GLOPL